jgi:hypothetical protein
MMKEVWFYCHFRGTVSRYWDHVIITWSSSRELHRHVIIINITWLSSPRDHQHHVIKCKFWKNTYPFYKLI